MIGAYTIEEILEAVKILLNELNKKEQYTTKEILKAVEALNDKN
jgi:hypothetical protein